MKKFLQIIFLLLAVNQFSFAQQNKLDSLNKILIISIEDTNKAIILNNIAKVWIKTNPDSAMKFALQTLHLSEKLSWRKGLWTGYHQIGSCYHYKSQYSDALANYEKAISVCELSESKIKLDNPLSAREVWKSGTLNNMGLIYTNLGDYPKALDYHLKSLILKERNEEPIIKDNINIANIYNYNSDFENAIKHYQKALQLATDSNNNDDKLIALGNLGSVYYKQKNYDKALNLYSQSLALAEQSGDKNLISERLANIGLVYGDQKDYVKSFDYLFKAIRMAEESGNVSNQVSFEGSLGSYYTQKGEYDNAEKYLLTALKKAKAIKQLNYIMQIENYLTELYKKTGEYKEALMHQDSAAAIKDSLFNLSKDNEIKNKMLGYEFDKKQAITKAENDAEIRQQKTLRNYFAIVGALILSGAAISIMLYKRKRDAEQETKETAAKLRISDTELKVLRLQINPHFIDNAMQRIQEFMKNHKSVEADAYLGKFSKLMRLFLENSKRDEIALSEELEALKLYMDFENLNMRFPFSYKFQIDENINTENTFVPPNILQPFVENSIKHGFALKGAPGNITIYIHKKEDDLHVIVEDDGIGRDESKRVKQPMLLNKESLGIKITQQRLNILNNKNNLNASFKIVDLFKDNKAIGTRVELNLPFQA